MLSWAAVEGPTGVLLIGADDEAVRELVLPVGPNIEAVGGAPNEIARVAACQLEEYLAGERRDFDLPLRSEGTDFQEDVWASLADIPYGEVRSYAWVADAIDRPLAARAVGQALGANPIPIFRACHRVTATGGIGGYGGGLELKRALLRVEGLELD